MSNVTDTPAFKKWFRGSKVVDARRQPLVVYHGTSRGGFTAFDTHKIDAHHYGFFFTSNRKVAETYTGAPEKEDPFPDDLNIPPFRSLTDLRRFLVSPQNNYDGWKMRLEESTQILDEADVDDAGQDWGDERNYRIGYHWYFEWCKDLRVLSGVPVAADIYYSYAQPSMRQLLLDARVAVREGPVGIPAGVYAVYLKMLNPLRVNGRGALWNHIPYQGGFYNTDGLCAKALSLGHDGVIFRQIYDCHVGQSEIGDVYVVFSPTQVKSAYKNKGTFDPEDPDIRHNGLSFESLPDGRLVGWRVASHEGGHAVSAADSHQKAKLRKGTLTRFTGKGMFLGNTREFVLDHYEVNEQNVLMRYAFHPEAVLSGNLTDREAEVSVAVAELLDWEVLRENATWGPLQPLPGVGYYRTLVQKGSIRIVLSDSRKNKMGEIEGVWLESLRTMEQSSHRCDDSLRALGLAEGDPVLEVGYVNLLYAFQGHGLGRLLYEMLMQEAFDQRGPFFFVPMMCEKGGDTSPEALRVWYSLARDYPSRGFDPYGEPFDRLGAVRVGVRPLLR